LIPNCHCRLGYSYVEATGDTENKKHFERRNGQAFGEKIIALIESFYYFIALIFFAVHQDTLQRGGGDKDHNILTAF